MLNGNKMKMMMLAVSSSLLISSFSFNWLSMPVQAAAFSDLPGTHWANSYVLDMAKRQVITGYEDGTFLPEKTINRAEFAVLLTKASERPQPSLSSSFSDVAKDAWYAPYAEAVKDALIGEITVNGTLFNADAPALREDVAVAIARSLSLPTANSAQVSFADQGEISVEARPYVAAALKAGLVSGYEDGTFHPKQTVTRAEAAAMLWKAFPERQTTEADNFSYKHEEVKSILADVTIDTLVAELEDPEQYTYRIKDIAVDDEDNIYFIEARKDRSSNLRITDRLLYKKLSGKTGVVINAPFGSENLENIPPTIKPARLLYDEENKQMFVGGYSTSKYHLSDKQGQTLIKKIDSSAETVLSVDSKTLLRDSFIGNLFLRLSEKRVLTIDTDSGVVALVDSSGAQEIGEIEATKASNRRIEALEANDLVYTFDTQSKALFVIDVNSLNIDIQKFTPFKQVDLPSISSVTVHDNKFYLASGNKIYRLNLDGTLTEFFDLSETRPKWGLFDPQQKISIDRIKAFGPIQSIDIMAFDKNENLVIYDQALNAIRRINLYVEPVHPELEKEQPASIAPMGERMVRSQVTADLLAAELYGNLNKKLESIDMVAGNGGDALVLSTDTQVSEIEKYKTLSNMSFYSGKTGTYESLSFDQSFNIVTANMNQLDNMQGVSGTSAFPKKLVYNPYTQETWVGTHYLTEKFLMFYRVKPDVKLRAYNDKLPKFSQNDFTVFASGNQFIYSSVADKKIFVETVELSDRYTNNDLQAYSFEFSGKKVVATENQGVFQIYDTGSQLLYTVELSSGKITGKTAVEQQLQHVAAQRGLIVGISGSKIVRLNESGKTEELADIQTIQIQEGVYDPVSKTGKPSKQSPTSIGSIKLLTLDPQGNPYLLDTAGALWRINLFE